MFRGNCPTRLDDKGRLKMPADFKHEIDSRYDGQFYITSMDGAVINCIPSRSGKRSRDRARSQPTSNRAVQKFLDITSYYGQFGNDGRPGPVDDCRVASQQFGLKGECGLGGRQVEAHGDPLRWRNSASTVEAEPAYDGRS